jgi:aryl-alcohol dehydrogenase-like predicted oxidoreductase
MKYSKLGKTDIEVSKICLGTMTYGEQNTKEEAYEQMDYAFEKGVNFFDVAEMYPVPPKAETQGRTEEIVGDWIKDKGKRQDIILASKVTGKSEAFRHVRNGEIPRVDRKNIEYAIDKSLKRLKTDYIDLYQIHWPDRDTNFFGKLGYQHNYEDDAVSLTESLEVLSELVKKGKIRYIGLSNETPWGVLDSIRASDLNQNIERIASIQNPYNLLNRTYEVGMAEISIREECGLLAYSPLAMGYLSGKYLNGAKPEGARLTIFDRFQRYSTKKSEICTEKYVKIAKENGISPTQLALAFVNSREFVTSNIIGATKIEQLEENISSININLNEKILEEVEKVHKFMPNPCP